MFFDVRNDSDALFSHFGIRMKGVIDLQLMESASRRTGANGKRFLASLGKCIQRDSGLSDEEKKIWETSKNKGKKLFAPEEGGRYRISMSAPYTMISRSIVSRMYDFYRVSTKFMK